MNYLHSESDYSIMTPFLQSTVRPGIGPVVRPDAKIGNGVLSDPEKVSDINPCNKTAAKLYAMPF